MLIQFRFLGKTALCLAGFAMLITCTSTTLTNDSLAAERSTPVTQAQWPKSFELVYCWGATNYNDIGPGCPCAELTLQRRPKEVDVYDCLTGNFYPAAGTWSKKRRWREVTFEFDGQVIYSGTRQPDGSYRGTMLGVNGQMGIWEGRFLP